MKTRVFQNWRSSLLGVILLIFSATLLCMEIITFTEFTFFLPTILGLLYIKDSVFRREKEEQTEI
ncbi:MAG: hypothetical protein M0Q38_06395 [Bacteroidales bacterium]|jgi:hypothetical protein|nr:hypothetical protein [Bacteroidales bacterium]